MNTLVQCSICLDQFTGELQDDMHATKCGHVFHKSCIVPWIKKSKNCPECRVPITTRNIFKLYLMCDKQAVKEKSTASEKSLVQTRFLEEANKKLQKENGTLKIQLGEATSESMVIKKRFEEQLDEKEKIIKRLKTNNEPKKSSRMRKPVAENIPDHTRKTDNYRLATECEYPSKTTAKRVKQNMNDPFLGTSIPAATWYPHDISDPLAEEIQRFRDNCQSHVETGRRKMMDARARMHFDYNQVW